MKGQCTIDKKFRTYLLFTKEIIMKNNREKVIYEIDCRLLVID